VKRVGVVGARGHVGSELVPLLAAHPAIDLAWVTSSTTVGAPVPKTSLAYRAADPALLHEHRVDAVLLALPNGESAAWARAAGDAIVVDLSGDNRFDDAWTYARPEIHREALRSARRIAVPGCYASAAHLAALPIRAALGDLFVWGVSGYSGAGTTKSERNDPDVLRDNLLPYGYADHLHERELRWHLGGRVQFMPHVASFFRGLVVTIAASADGTITTSAALEETFKSFYAREPFVRITTEAPRPRDSAMRHDVAIGGFTVKDGGKSIAVVAALDNLLGGAASQAVRALNLALGWGESTGIS
jgi:N-acetyl-gamma-glutamyl-phosphate reductase common form